MADKQTLYCLYDKVSERYTHFMLADNDAMYVRELISHRVAFPLNFRDCVPYRVCSSDELHFSDMDLVSWDSWKTPETAAEILAPLGLTDDEISSIIKRRQQTVSKQQFGDAPLAPDGNTLDNSLRYVNEKTS